MPFPAFAVVDCGSPGHMTNAEVVFNLTTFEETANNTCEIGFKFPSGASLVVTSCSDSGNWTAVNETCQGVYVIQWDAFTVFLFGFLYQMSVATKQCKCLDCPLIDWPH